MTTNAQSTAHPAPLRDPSAASRWLRSTGRFIRRYPLGALGALMALTLIAMAIAPALFTPFAAQDPLAQNLGARLAGPSWDNWFGTDELGRDLYARIVYGARTSITIGFGVVLVSQTLAVVVGTVSGYFGGWFDTLLQRIIDIGIAIPGLVFIILVVVTLSTRMPDILYLGGDMVALIISLSILIASSASRTVRGVALSLSNEQYVEAATALGATHTRIMRRHIVPNLFAVVIVSASILVGSAVLIESALSFLGYGVQPPTPSWGRMLNDARRNLTYAPHMAIFPGLVIFMTVYSFNMLGDALRDKLDPRLRGAN